jgi:ABC-type multidrug transport system permease subunit
MIEVKNLNPIKLKALELLRFFKIFKFLTFFSSLISLIGKNLRMFFRSRVSAAAVILVPFMIIMLTGFAFNSSNLSNVNVAIYSGIYSNFTNDLISDFEGNGFTSNKYPSADACIESVKQSESQICIIFPEDLSPDISSEDIVFHADYSRVNLAGTLINEIQEGVLLRTSGVGEDLAQGLIDSLETLKESLPASKEKIDKALSDALANKNANSNIVFPTDEISLAIEDLEEIVSEINISEVDDIEEVLVNLRLIESTSLDVSDDLEDMTTKQNEVISDLGRISTELNVIISSLNSQRVISAGNVVSPITTRIEAINTDSTNKDYMIPIVFSLIALFGAILLSSTFVLKEKKTKAFFRNFMAPVKNTTFIFSTYLTCLFIILLQFIPVIIGVRYILKMNIFDMIFPLIIVLFMTVSVFIAIGMFIGYLFRSEETIIFSSMIIAALLMFFSNVILPLENISSGFMTIFKFNPLVLSNLAFKKVMLFGFGFGSIWVELLILLAFFVVFFILNCIFRQLTRRIL